MSENFKSIRTTLVAMLLLLGGVVAQAQTVKVNVKDSSGEAVIGASVIEKTRATAALPISTVISHSSQQVSPLSSPTLV